MRLFTAVLFGNGMKDSLYGITERLRGLTDRGSFTDRDNLHLTLNFIGETDRREQVEQAMRKAVANTGTNEFTLTVSGFGRFKRREGDILWVGVEECESLWNLQKELVTRLKEEGFPVDDLSFTPHLTLARRAILVRDFDEKAFCAGVSPMSMEVKEVSLMKSERIRGKLVYTRIYGVALI